MPNFEKVQHRLFGTGFLFGPREISAGQVVDVWFVPAQKMRTILAEPTYWIDPPEEQMEF